jgi:uncharacterized damage-inducible protein DinB
VTMTPEQATFLLQMFLPTLKNEYGVTKKIIEAIPLDKGDYRPDPVSMSALELARHIVAAENMFLDGIASGGFNFSLPKPESLNNSAEVARWYEETFNANIARVSQLSADQLLKVVDFRGLFQFPAIVYVQFTMNHTIHHRGQLSTYLRPMGAKVPSIYGESYDVAEARKAAAGVA